MPDPSKPVPLEAEIVEAAANALHDKHWPSVHNHGAPCSLCVPYAETAILAADEARGMRVEKRERYNERARAYYPPEQRLVSEWRSVDAP